MDITTENMDILFRQVQNTFQSTLQKTPKISEEIATTIPMGTRQMTQAFLDRLPQLREWTGNRQINNPFAHSRVITARVFEDTVGLSKWDIIDEQMQVFGYSMNMLAEAAAKWPDKLVNDYIMTGASTINSFDGVPLYSTAHPLLGGVAGGIPTGAPSTQSNLLLNTPLTFDNVIKARATMRSWRGSDGAPMNAEPNVLMVPPQLQGKAQLILETDFLAQFASSATSNSPQSNFLKNTMQVLVNPFLSSYADENGVDGNWWLLDTRSTVKPFAHYQLTTPTMTALVNPNDPNVFMNAQFMWGVEARGEAAETVWWLSLAGTSESTYIP